MQFLYERIEVAKVFGVYKELPHCIKDNLTEKFEIRPYQEEAFCNYITYFENDQLRNYRNQTLFHMATGSGKTYIMAGLILYLYQKGYRNFLFFASMSNIISKTKDNFTNSTSSKYLFAEKIVIDGMEVKIREVNSFQDSSTDCINICFSTIQTIHNSYTDVKENGLSMDDFRERDIVFISDEAHHLTVDTVKKKKKINNDDESKSWEYVAKQLFRANPNNVLLEFTATCKLQDLAIKDEYLDKIVYNYDLKKYRLDGYSKEIRTLQTGLSFIDMAIQAAIISQYRLKIFNEHHLNIKPIILFKSRTIKESINYFNQFCKEISNISSSKISEISPSHDPVIRQMYDYFSKHGITFEILAQEIKESFAVDHILMINQYSDIETNSYVNSMENSDNPYRVIFEVDKLDEGWDVLNLFDIVKLYDTKDAKEGVLNKTTVAEAQLIGRGARYCPFILEDDEDKYKRKFDSDLNNPMRVCEELYYHCHTDSRYIRELHKALVDNGMIDEEIITQQLKLKTEFKETQLYKYGSVLVNDQIKSSRENVYTLSSELKDKTYNYKLSNKSTDISNVFDVELLSSVPIKYRKIFTVKEIAEMNYNIVHSALRVYSKFRFDILKSYFPHLVSIKEFIESPNYMANIRIEIESECDVISMEDFHKTCLYVFEKISEGLSDINITYAGTETFRKVRFKDIFKDKSINYTDPKNEGVGVSQATVHTYRLDLSNKEWFVFNDNYGTSEEKGFVSYFSSQLEYLKEKYEQVYLVRNERHMHIYSFLEGRRFEPDFLLFLRNKDLENTIDQMQIFIEPKGSNLMLQDKWKEDFLLQIVEKWKLEPITFIDDTKYKVIGLPFYNNESRKSFDEAFEKLL